MKYLGVWLYAIQLIILGIGLMIYMNDFLWQRLGGPAIVPWSLLAAYTVIFLYRLIRRINFSYWAGEKLGEDFDRFVISGH